jgi:hypothetical protein
MRGFFTAIDFRFEPSITKAEAIVMTPWLEKLVSVSLSWWL